MFTYKKQNMNGFTLIEVLVTLTIIGLLAAIAAPSLLGFTENGKQTNRNYVARTLFLAAQSSLTNMKINEHLETFVKFTTDPITKIETAEIKNTAVKKSTETAFSGDGDGENNKYIYYMTIQRDDVTGDGKTLYDFLDSYVLDKHVLKKSVCIEFNAKTGVVKSAFFSENLVGDWTYGGDLNGSGNLMKRDLGSLATKRQGYYGVLTTGAVSPDSIPIKITLKDAADEPTGAMKNVLYAEALVPTGSEREYTLELLKEDGTVFGDNTKFTTKIVPIVAGDLGTAFFSANKIDGKHLVYKEVDTANPIYTKIVWAIDVVNSETTRFADMTDSIGVKYPEVTPQTILVRITESESNRVEKSNKSPSHFGIKQGTGTDIYNQIKDTRHLNNIRYMVGGNFLQMNDITACDYKSEKVTLAPLNVHFDNAGTITEPDFTGKYFGAKSNAVRYTIYDLNIQNPPTDVKNVGMFGSVSGQLINTSIDNATITAKDGISVNVGGLAGSLNGTGSIVGSSSFANVCAGDTSTKNVGGLVGNVAAGGKISQSFNAGFFDAKVKTATNSDGHFGSVTAAKGNVGGLVGLNAGTIETGFNNARVNISNVTVTTTGADRYLSRLPMTGDTSGTMNFGGIAGQNSGTIKNTYATNYVGSKTGSKSGGIVGNNATAAVLTNNFYISNGSTDLAALTKQELAARVITGFNNGSWALYTQGENTYDKYPYPVLASNPVLRKDAANTVIATDKRGWEDIKEASSTTAELLYYERYDTVANIDKIIGYSKRKGETASTLITDASESLVANDGYCLEFGYANKLTLKVGGKDYVLTDTNNSSTNPIWRWDDNPIPKMTNLPQSFVKAGEPEKQYRLFLNNVSLEAAANGATPILIQLENASGRNILVGSKTVGSDTVQTDVYVNPLFANAIYTEAVAPTEYIARSPRHIDNVDKALAMTFKQELSVDFKIYRSELIFTSGVISLDDAKKMPTDKSVVDGTYTGIYDGANHFIRNVNVTSTANEHVGLFSSVTGTAENIALIMSNFDGTKDVGGIAGSVLSGGKIERCEVSDVIVNGTSGNIGGIAGNNAGTISNVYFNSTHRDETSGVYASPVTGNANSSTVGGLVGYNSGTLTNAYSTARGQNNKPTIGTGNNGTNVFYLTGGGYNESADSTGLQGVGKKADELATALSGGEWETATKDTTKFTVFCKDRAYDFPKLANMHHYRDWPTLVSTLLYYEIYSDGDIGFFSRLGKESGNVSDTLKYDPNLTVVEEGYLIEVTTLDEFDIRFSNTNLPQDDPRYKVEIGPLQGEEFHGRRVVKLSHSMYENLFFKSYTNGMTPISIQVSLTSENKEDFANILYGTEQYTDIFFNPQFAKEITFEKRPASGMVNVIDKDFDIRSPRQMLNINKNDGSSDSRNHRLGYNYKQTISINFARAEIDGRKPFLQDGNPIAAVGKNILTNLCGNYDGNCNGQNSRIYNLVMNVPNNNSAGAFGNLGQTSINSADNITILDTAVIKNLDFVDAQARYARNGMGGGIVANINYGTIDNVNVYNNHKQQLFADENGTVNTQFCASIGNLTTHPFNEFAHAHGGIAGVTYGQNAKITNCIVGTNSDNINEIFDNKTQITCFSSASQSPGNNGFTLLGGIVGGISDGAKVISSVNIATVMPNLSTMAVDTDASTHCIGGIAGRGGNQRKNPNATFQIIGCYNAGTIKSTFGFIGGIVGRTLGINEQTPSEVMSCYNTGRVNVEYDSNGKLIQTAFRGGNIPLRIGGIAGEVGYTKFVNCYNIGYLSGNIPPTNKFSAAGAVVGLSSDGNTVVENCFSLAADQYKPETLLGTKYDSTGRINNLPDPTTFVKLFAPYWETRASLRQNKILISPSYGTETYPGLTFTKGASKTYPVFSNTDTSFYIYPQLSSFQVGEITYHNPHITPWESIDADFNATLKYYEKYAKPETETDIPKGTYYLNMKGESQDTLKDDSIITEDGYYLAITAIKDAPKYKVVINNVPFEDVAVVPDVNGMGESGIAFTKGMIDACKPGYNKIRLFTMLPENGADSAQNIEDNKLNRLVGTTTTADGNAGLDLYLDYSFPREIKRDDSAAVPTKETLDIRSPRHLAAIGKSTAATPNFTKDKFYTQKLDLDFAQYPTLANLTDSVVTGSFEGTFDGGYKTISNVTIAGAATVADVGLFAQNKGTIHNFKLENSVYTSTAAATLNVGAVAAQNTGTIERVAVVIPTLTGSATAPTQTIGGIAGTNEATGSVNNVYLVAEKTESDTPIKTTGTGTNTLGGLVGNNAGSIELSLYLAKAPFTTAASIPPAADVVTAYPITGANTGTVDTNVHYLAGVGYNDGTINPLLGGTKKSTAEITTLRDMLLPEWAVNWGKFDAHEYPYPSLNNITPPTTFPEAIGVVYTLAYYEEYKDNTHGWYYYDATGTLQTTLDDAKTISKTGYYIIMPDTVAVNDEYDLSVGGVNVNPKPKVIEIDSKKIIELPPATTDTKPIEIKLNARPLPFGYTYYNPLFAKGIYKEKAAPTGATFEINTPAQMQNIGTLTKLTPNGTAGITFKQERNLDFTGISLTDSIVTGEFQGIYDGTGKTISNVTITATAVDNIGLFSQNKGTIKAISLKPTTTITGKDNVGGIVGSNLLGATIEGCTVEGAADPLTPGIGMDITGVNNVGGIVGTNAGVITGCTVQNTTSTITGDDYVGGIAGRNEATGTITGATVNKVKIVATTGTNFGALCGANENKTAGSVEGTETNVIMDGKLDLTALEAAIATANDLYNSNTWGTEIGMHPTAMKEDFKKAIDAAQAVVDRAKPTVPPTDPLAVKPTPDEVKAATTALEAATKLVTDSIIKAITLNQPTQPAPPTNEVTSSETSTEPSSSDASSTVSSDVSSATSSEASSATSSDTSSATSSDTSSATSSEASSVASSDTSSATSSEASSATSSEASSATSSEASSALSRAAGLTLPSEASSATSSEASSATSSDTSSATSSDTSSASSETSSIASSTPSSDPLPPIEPVAQPPVVSINVVDSVVDENGTPFTDRAVVGKLVTVTVSGILPENEFKSITVMGENNVPVKTTVAKPGEQFLFLMPAASVSISIDIGAKATAPPIEPPTADSLPPMDGLSLAGLPLYFLDRHEKLRGRAAKWFKRKSK